ncbi:uncharacterized protein MELLADRAFT_62390 [Melampsora larici-populina 98AG31]|uniref:Secreted protein n=1 Tax=Melampsora larici-populina (strain 98AG31 / pathotype 3-4-7) TaxID=747676 RepID=F4RIT3_MELLP|nr:uncharacterized protein MELLADRAFT_62390 [Melampsora larici-populina 98AG31]EGG07618.1 hypothetical protein MELLADRAFT_62390 [Melampsora larici-populina 98AG31]
MSILLLLSIEKLTPTQAKSLDGNYHQYSNQHDAHRSLVRLTRRRMNQELNLKMPVTEPCDGRICATVAGKVIGARLAAAAPCARQDIADQLITDAKVWYCQPQTNPLVKDDKLRVQLIAWAKLICESEKNTHPDYSKNPQTQRNFLYCLKAPVNHELDDCIPKQFEGNDPNVFFDPKVGSVALGSRPETFPRQKQPGGSTTQTQNASTAVTAPANATSSTAVTAPANATSSTTVTAPANTTTSTTTTEPANSTTSTTVTEPINTTTSTLQLLSDSTPTTTDSNKDNNSPKTDNSDQGGKKGAVDASKGKVVDASTLPEKCNKPEVRYDGGLGGRKATEMSYEPVDKTFYAHGTALSKSGPKSEFLYCVCINRPLTPWSHCTGKDFQIITDAMCDKILACLKGANKKEDEVQKVFKSCKDVSKAIGPVKKDGKAADDWNAAYVWQRLILDDYSVESPPT